MGELERVADKVAKILEARQAKEFAEKVGKEPLIRLKGWAWVRHHIRFTLFATIIVLEVVLIFGLMVSIAHFFWVQGSPNQPSDCVKADSYHEYRIKHLVIDIEGNKRIINRMYEYIKNRGKDEKTNRINAFNT